MRKYLLISSLIFVCLSGFGQVDYSLNGRVMVQNSRTLTGKVEYLSNVSVSAAKSTPQLSDEQGRFTLLFSDVEQGNDVVLAIEKKGYEVVNVKDLNVGSIVGRKSPIEIYMCKTGEQQRARLEYHGLIDEKAEQDYQQRLEILRSENERSQILINELENEFSQKIESFEQANNLLNISVENYKRMARELADKFITINLDDKSEEYRKAYLAFKEKDISLAIKILDGAEIEKRLKINFREKNKEERLIEIREKKLAERNAQINDDIDNLVLKARLYRLNYDNNSAEKTYQEILKYDDTNLTIRTELAEVLRAQGKLESSRIEFEKNVKYINSQNSKEIENEIILCRNLIGLGRISFAENRIEESKCQFLKVRKVCEALDKKYFHRYVPYLADSYIQHALVLLINNSNSEAEQELDEINSILSSMKKAPGQELFSSKFMIERLFNEILVRKGSFNKSLKGIEKLVELVRARFRSQPSLYYLSMLSTLTSFGNALRHDLQLIKSSIVFQEAMKIVDTYLVKKSQTYYFHKALLHFKLGENYKLQGFQILAESNFKEGLDISSNNLNQISLGARNIRIIALTNLGEHLMNNGREEEALIYLREAEVLIRELVKSNRKIFLSSFAVIVGHIGRIIGEDDFEEGAIYLEESLLAFKELISDGVTFHLPALAIIYFDLGFLYYLNFDFSKAEIYCQKVIDIEEEMKKRFDEYEQKPKTTQPNGWSSDTDFLRARLLLCKIFSDLLVQTNKKIYRRKGRKLLSKIKTEIAKYENNQELEKYKKEFLDLKYFYNNIKGRDYSISLYMKELNKLQDRIRTEENPLNRINSKKEILEILEKIKNESIENDHFLKMMPDKYSNLAFDLINIGEFESAEKILLSSLEMDENHLRSNGLMILALVAQDRIEGARTILARNKDRLIEGSNFEDFVILSIQIMDLKNLIDSGFQKVDELIKY